MLGIKRSYLSKGYTSIDHGCEDGLQIPPSFIHRRVGNIVEGKTWLVETADTYENVNGKKVPRKKPVPFSAREETSV